MLNLWARLLMPRQDQSERNMPQTTVPFATVSTRYELVVVQPKVAEPIREESEQSYLEKKLLSLNDPQVTVRTKQILTGREYQIFDMTRTILKDSRFKGWLVFAQVSLGELFRTNPTDDAFSLDAFFGFNDKRCDVVVTDSYGYPILMIEYQGKNHEIGKYCLRSEIKRRVYQKANVRLLEITHLQRDAEVRTIIREALNSIYALDEAELYAA